MTLNEFHILFHISNYIVDISKKLIKENHFAPQKKFCFDNMVSAR